MEKRYLSKAKTKLTALTTIARRRQPLLWISFCKRVRSNLSSFAADVRRDTEDKRRRKKEERRLAAREEAYKTTTI